MPEDKDIYDVLTFEMLRPDEQEFLAKYALLDPEKQKCVVQKLDELIERRKHQDK